LAATDRRHNYLGAVLVAVALCAAPGYGREVSVPMQLDHAFLQRLMLTQVFTGPEETAPVYDDGLGCNLLILSQPEIAEHDGRLRIRAAARAAVGFSIATFCIPFFDWLGTVEVDELPTIDARRPIVRFQVIDSNLYGIDGSKRVTGRLWDWVKDWVHPRLEAVSVDLAYPLDELREFLPLVLHEQDATQMTAVLDSVQLADARATAEGLVVEVRFEVPEQPAPPTLPAPEPTLSPEEIVAWEANWQQWDAFVTFVSKHTAEESADAAQRQALLDVLIEARYDILWVLRPSAPGEPDPVPALFVKTWARLAPIVRQLSLGLPGEATLRYVSFIAAADALRAIQEIGPQSGIDISADGLRRLARMIAPAAPEDPLEFDDAVDPALRELFGFGEPLPPPADNPEVDIVLRWLLPAPAWASDLSARLNRWAPTTEEVPEYLPLVRDLLNQTAQTTLSSKPLESRFHDLFGTLMLATAWKESCWRQFVRSGDRLTPLRSPVGAVGIMQVNPRVWRGFYDVKGLNQDIGYNALAGSEILLHYLRDYAIARGEHTKTGSVDNLARAAYAAYNGGPGHLTRYRKSKGSRSLRRIDESFLEKYRKVKSGQTLAVAECFGL
jgi:hypothetical protein